MSTKQRNLGEILQEFSQHRLVMQQELQKIIIGQNEVIEQMFAAIFTRGHCLLEGVPGLAKTLMVSTLAQILDVGFKRIQFTPDLMPSDITGTNVLEEDERGKRSFRFMEGPIFTNILLADEINRTPPKTQAALLQAMQEREVSVGRQTYELPDPFFTIATQNPIEQEGTYPLPEAQMDRFLMQIYINYPDEPSEIEVIRLVRGEEGQGVAPKKEQEKVTIAQQHIFEARSQIYEIHVSDAIEKYIMDLITATRQPERYGEDLKKWIHIGASPRGGIGLDKCSRVHAWLQSRDYVTPDDVREVVNDVLRHRIMLSYEANAEGITSDQVIAEIVKKVAVA